jgi:hypothetical protein
LPSRAAAMAMRRAMIQRAIHGSMSFSQQIPEVAVCRAAFMAARRRSSRNSLQLSSWHFCRVSHRKR